MEILRLLPIEIISLVLKGGSLWGENRHLKLEDGIRREWGIFMGLKEKPRRKAGMRTENPEFFAKKLAS